MTTLSAAVDADDKLWTVDTLPASPYVEADAELLAISASFPEHIYPPTQETIPARIRVVRAQAGTTAASHNQGITLTPVYPESATSPGGGGVTVDNQSDPPAEVTTLVAPGATIAGDEATLATVQVLLSTTTLTDAQIKALPTTAVQLIAAPGAGSMIVPLAAVLRLTWVADYTNIDANCKLAVTQASSAATNPVFLTILEENPDIGVSGLLALGDSAFAIFGPRLYGAEAVSQTVHASGGWNTFSVENVPLYLRATNGVAGAFTGGDAGNSLKVTVIYTVIPV